MNVWYRESDTICGPVWMLLQLDLVPDDQVDGKLLAVVGQRWAGGWQGLIARKKTFPDEDPARQLGIHPNQYEAMGEVLEHLGIKANYFPQDV